MLVIAVTNIANQVELDRSSSMTALDYNALLGKRVEITQFSHVFDDVTVEGIFLGYHVIHSSVNHDSNEILFLEDGFDEPDWVHFDFLYPLT